MIYVRFTPESRHSALQMECPLSANSGHRAVSFNASVLLQFAGQRCDSVFSSPGVAVSPS